jgi:hypothetical protein
MVLNEAPGGKIQQTWYSRLARERRELSVSVEEAQVNTPPGEGLRLDDQGQHVTIVDTGKRNNVFPPRLSLQSRFLPGSPYRVGTGLVNAQGNTVRRTSIWARLVQCLTLLFGPLLSRSAANTTIIPIERENMSKQSSQVKDVVYTGGEASDPSVKHVFSAKNHEVGSKGERRVITGTNARHGALRSRQGLQRLGGRATRIRLEVVPAPSVEYALNKEKIPAPDIAAFANNSSTSHHLPAIEKATKQLVADHPFGDDDRGTTSVLLPAVEKVTKRPVEDRAFEDSDGGTTSIRLAAIGKAVRRREEPSPAWHTGAGMFECGQRDVTISDPSVTASSVVLVTLTANPGPVVVQYVSLQPRTGFTVHLTAPTTMGAPFNYVVLGSRPFLIN